MSPINILRKNGSPSSYEYKSPEKVFSYQGENAHTAALVIRKNNKEAPTIERPLVSVERYFVTTRLNRQIKRNDTYTDNIIFQS